MATINTAIKLNDQMRAPLRSMVAAVDSLINVMEKAQIQSGKMIDPGMGQARVKLSQARAEIDNLGASTDRAADKQRKLTQSAHDSSGAFKNFGNVVKTAFMAFGGYQAGRYLIETSDKLVSVKARLSLINDGLQTQVELQDKVFASAQRSRASYTETAAAVSKMGLNASKAFSSNDELIKFTELMNKQFVVGGAEQSEQWAARLQLTQAMSSGRLQGDEYRTIIEAAPLLKKSIEDYMTGVVKAKGSMKEWAKEGMLTAEVIKAAMFNSSNDIEDKFKSMPVTFAQRMEIFKNSAINALEPVLDKLSEVANSPEFADAMQKVTNALVLFGGIALAVFDGAGKAINWLGDNMSTIAPIIGIVAGAMLLFNVATMLATASQWNFNIAMLASPMTWIILVILLVIVALVALAAYLIKVSTKFSDTFGIIVGIVFVAGALIYNAFVMMWNAVLGLLIPFTNNIAMWIQFFVNIWTDPIGAIKKLFLDMFNFIVTIAANVARIIDDIFGSKLSDSINSWKDSALDGMSATLGVKYEEPKNIMDGWKMDRLSLTGSFESGYNAGVSLKDKLKFDKSPASGLGDYNLDPNSYQGQTAANTKKIADSVTATEEDIKSLLDLAERDTINRFTTAQIKVEMNNENIISSEMDIDGVIRQFADKLQGAMAGAAEGAY